MKAVDFDKKFESGEDITALLDLNKTKRPSLALKRINVDLPEWMIESLDREARRIGTTRQSLIKFWVSDNIDNKIIHQ